MTTLTRQRLRIVIRVDALARSGVGHLVRQLALAEELTERGHDVVLLGISDVSWALAQVATRGLDLIPAADPDGIAAQVATLDGDVVMIDGYDFAPAVGANLLAANIPVATMVDGPFGTHQIASVYIDQNLHPVLTPSTLTSDAAGQVAGLRPMLGATPGLDVRASSPQSSGRPASIPGTADFLCGLEYALLRDQIRHRRGLVQTDLAPPRVLVVFGGTDAYGGAGVVVPLLFATGVPHHIVAIAANDDIADQLRTLSPGPGQSIDIMEPVDDLGGLAADCQAAVIAAGTTVWEFMCLGLPTALVCVTDNQEVGYTEAARTRVHTPLSAGRGLEQGSPICVPAGKLADLRADQAARAESIGRLRSLVVDAQLRREIGAASSTLVDGDGRIRVADRLELLAAAK